MIFGLQVTLPVVMVGGVALFALIAVELLIGYRKIKFKGPQHRKVHKAVAWAIVVVGVLHGIMAAILYTGVSIG